jgi:uroporphyrinogen-III synthase
MIVPPLDWTLLDTALVELSAGQYAWLVFTSVNAVTIVTDRLAEQSLTLPPTVQIGVVGATTAAAVQRYLGRVALTLPATYTAAALAQQLPLASGTRVLLPESALADPTLAHLLMAQGASVQRVCAYQTVCAPPTHTLLPRLAHLDALTFTSPSTVHCLLTRLGELSAVAATVREICAVCIGTTTAAAAREHGFRRVITAADHTLTGLVAALEHYFAKVEVTTYDEP